MKAEDVVLFSEPGVPHGYMEVPEGKEKVGLGLIRVYATNENQGGKAVEAAEKELRNAAADRGANIVTNVRYAISSGTIVRVIITGQPKLVEPEKFL